jgi:Outer membrane protein beta-barrel domain
VPIGSALSFRPELNFVQKGFKLDFNQSESGFGIISKGNQTLNFIELPLNVIYNVSAGSGNFFLGAGPAIGYGISGKNSFTSVVMQPGLPDQSTTDNSIVKFDGKKDEDVAADDDNTHLKALDFGGNFLAGYKMSNGLFLNVAYTLGFSNLDPNANSSYKTNGISIKLGYMFGGKGDK